MKNLKRAVYSLCFLSSMVVASNVSATLSNVIPIPWEGDITKFHTALSNQTVTVKGVIKTTDTTTVSNQWNFGDGTPFSSWNVLSGNTRYAVSTTHIYQGAAGTPFVAWLIATDGTTTMSNRYLVQIQAPGLSANVNLAIDEGLWYEYNQAIYAPTGHNGYINTMDSTPAVGWAYDGQFGSWWACSTASSIQAFEINGSLATGNFNQDPYAEYVALGLNYLFKGYSYNTSYPVLQAVNIAPRAIDPWDNPDSNGNGIGVQTFDDGGSRCPYQGGMIMDAIVASGTPNASTGRIFTGTSMASYKDVVQDMCDMYAWGEDNEDFNWNWVSYPSTLTTLPPNVTPDSVTFNTYDLSCTANDGTYTFYINGQNVGTSLIANYCNCNGGGNSVAVSGSALATAWNMASPPTIGVSYSGGTSHGPVWVHASLSFGGDLLTLCLTNLNTSGGCDYEDGCVGGVSSGGEAAFSASNYVSSYPVLSDDLMHQQEIIGSWHYTWQYGDPGDNSASQWAAIGQIAAEQPPFSCVVPNWVKTNDNNYLNYSYTTDNGGAWGHFGYNSPGQFVQPDYYGDADTPSGFVQMIYDGFTTADPRFVAAETWLAQNWDSGENWLSNIQHNTLYPAYSVAKAMRLAQPAPIVDLSPTGFDWYAGNSGDTNGLAETLSDNLLANNGHWYSPGGYGDNGNYWEGPTMGTAWAIIILKPNLFSAGPTACFSDNPNPNFANKPTYFDPTCSTDPQVGGISNLTSFVWNWGDGTPDTTNSTPEVVAHSFACPTLPCSYVVTLTVTDNSTPPLTSSDQQTINITEPPHPPVAITGGPYIVSLSPGDTLTLDGSQSYTPDAGLSQANCDTCPPDELTAYGWALKGAPYIYTDNTDEVADLGTGFTSFFPTAGTYPISLQVADNAALSFPGGATADLTDAAFGWVTNFAAGPTVSIAGACDSVTLSWNNTGATQYLVLASLTGPNTGFAVLGSTTGATTVSVPAVLGQNVWYRVEALAASGTSLSSDTEYANAFANCICISPVTVQTKNLQVALSWPAVDGATGYNIYRGTAPGVALTKANRIATGVGLPNNDYTDLTVVNGRTYYYQISVVVNGVETCRSEEVSGKAEAVVR